MKWSPLYNFEGREQNILQWQLRPEDVPYTVVIVM